MAQKIQIKNKAEMARFARDFAKKANKGSIIGLKGSLGSGKSFFAQNFINELLDEKAEILSPTFNLVLSYDTKKGEVFHFDLYRLKSPQELENIDFFDIIKNGICLIEWPQIAEKFLQKLPQYTEIKIEIGEDEERTLILSQKS